MRFIVDARTGQRTNDAPAITRNQMSWRRLAETLKEAGHVQQHETLTHFIVEDGAIQLCFETNP